MISAVRDQSSIELRGILEQANPAVLRMALYQATRDPALAAMDVERRPVRGGAYFVPVLASRHHDDVVEKALAFLSSDSDRREMPTDDEQLRAMMELFAGEPVSQLAFELGRGDICNDAFPITAAWKNRPSDQVRSRYKVAIIGAGFGGLAAAVMLKNLGLDFEIIERADEVGGTWRAVHYPEARVDIASHHYQLSFMKRHKWRNWYATADELLEYARSVAERFDLRRHISFGTQLKAARWDEDASKWRLTLEREGRQEIREFTMVISAAGLFNSVNVPAFEGIDSFAGQILHPADWDHDCDLVGKNVVQIGVGSTGAQIMPYLARAAANLAVFQRSPQWVMPIEGYRDPIPDGVQWLFENFPHYWGWQSFFSFYANLGSDPSGLHDYDPDWQKRGGVVSERNDNLRTFCENYIRSKVGHDPALVAKTTPEFPPFGKRPVIDNGWFDALAKPNVELVTEPIDRVTPHAVVARDGTQYPADAIVMCAGYTVERYLWPATYTGRDGKALEEVWSADGPRAHLGMTVPGFPNLFILYGPNSQARTGGLIKWLESWARYSVSLIVEVIERGARSISVKQTAFDDYNARLDQAAGKLVWKECPSYYLNAHGRQGVNAPWLPADYWSMIRAPDLSHFEIRQD